MRPLPLILAVMLAGALGPDAVAQTAALKDVKQGTASPLRYRFSHVNDGVMRLDHQTGRLVFCKSLAPGKWQCDPVPEEEGVLLAQLKQAETDNTKLTEQLGELQKHFGMPEEERAALKAAIEKSQADSAAAKSELGALREEIASLKQQLANNQPAEALKAELAAMRRDIANVGTQVTAQKQGEAQRAEITKLQSENWQLNDQVAALRDETAAMQKRIAELEPPRPPAPVPAPKSSELKVPQMPSKDELAQARAALTEAWRRVVEMLNDIKRDLTGKSDEDSVRL